jgi:hypothetical protein
VSVSFLSEMANKAPKTIFIIQRAQRAGNSHVSLTFYGRFSHLPPVHLKHE